MSSESKYALITGAAILTLAGLISRVTGFFYRIFLSHSIGAEGMGIYQMIFPVYGFCFALVVSGMQTAISRSCAASWAADVPGRRKPASWPVFLFPWTFSGHRLSSSRAGRPAGKAPFHGQPLYPPASADRLRYSFRGRPHLHQRVLLRPE